MAARLPLIAGNWKMNLNHLEAIGLVQKIAFSLPEKYFAKVEVLLDNGGTGQTRLHAAAEQRRKAATTAAVQEHEQHQQHAGDDQQDLQEQDHFFLAVRQPTP